MERHSVEAIVEALNAAGVRYLVAGGLAVVAHGCVRFTADVDLIIDFEGANVRRAVAALSRLGYQPRAPVAFEEFADAGKRAEWVRDKGLTVFSSYSSAHPLTEIDLFVDSPLDFDVAYQQAARREVGPDHVATFVGIKDLIRLKKQAARPQDLLDIERRFKRWKAKPMSRKGEELLWEEGWDGHHARQLERMARLPLVDKLRWLEEAHYLVRRLSAGMTTDPGQSARSRTHEP
jgi:hypothetical protein